MEKALREIQDHNEIGTVLVDYCRHLDRMDLKALSHLFTEDCVVIYGPDPKLAAAGRSALVTSLARMWRWQRTAHHLSNVRIWFDGENEARSESYVYAWHEKPDGRTASVFGRYLDHFSKTPEGWQIAERRMDMNGADQRFKVSIPQAPRCPSPKGWQSPEGLDD